MTPKEKAKELFDIYYQLAESIEWTDKETMQKAELLNDELGDDILFYWHELAKQSALIAVDEIINSDWFIQTIEDFNAWKNYWQEVKQEIEKL